MTRAQPPTPDRAGVRSRRRPTPDPDGQLTLTLRRRVQSSERLVFTAIRTWRFTAALSGRRTDGHTGQCPVARRPRADGRGEPQPSPRGCAGLDAARVRPVVAGPRLRRPGGRGVVGGPVAALADR